METVLREDREALRSMQKHQPRFTEDQKRELSQMHPWVRTGRLPRAINISVNAELARRYPSPVPVASEINTQSCFQGCKGCKSNSVVPPADPFDVEIHEMEHCGVLNAQEDGGKGRKNLSEILMEEEEEEEKTAKTQDDSQDMPAEEASSDGGAEKLDINQ